MVHVIFRIKKCKMTCSGVISEYMAQAFITVGELNNQFII